MDRFSLIRGVFWLEGSWTDTGLKMHLRFTPGIIVDATQIGLVQVVRTLVKGVPHAAEDADLSHAIPLGEQDAGAMIDCASSDRNPVYGLTLRPGEGDGSSTNLSQGRLPPGGVVALGAHRPGENNPTEATMLDLPSVPLTWGSCSQQFETAAVALAGSDRGKYYGFALWGWERDDAGRRQLELKAYDLPSARFRRAALYWNKAATTSPIHLLTLPPLPQG